MTTRPEDTHKSRLGVLETDMNLLYWGGGACEVWAEQVCGKCEVVFGEDLPGDRDDWFLQRTDRFYYYEAYNRPTNTFMDPPASSRLPGRKGKVTGSSGWVRSHSDGYGHIVMGVVM